MDTKEREWGLEQRRKGAKKNTFYRSKRRERRGRKKEFLTTDGPDNTDKKGQPRMGLNAETQRRKDAEKKHFYRSKRERRCSKGMNFELRISGDGDGAVNSSGG